MPRFRDGPIEVNPFFDGETLSELRDVGHGHRINIVDASYDIPRSSRRVDFPQSSAEALLGVARLIPIEDDLVIVMSPDPELGGKETKEVLEDINGVAWRKFEAMRRILGDRRLKMIEGRYRYGKDESDCVGFYDLANNPDEAHLFMRTIDDLPFACASLVAGHSQRTE